MLAGDSTVVFNEVMYHPAGDSELEWVELHNQMAVDMDLSGWRLDGGIDFEFSQGAVLAGGEYLVVAADPQRLQTQTGFAGAIGPYTGRLSNGGERVELLNNSQRLMDVLDYRDGGDWPVGPDGSGASLAKLDPDSASEPAANWRTSVQAGGTPRAVNFTSGPALGPEISLLPIDATWWYDDSGTDQGDAWKEVGFSPDGAGWQSGGALLFNETAALPSPKTTPLSPDANTYYFRTEFLFDGDPNIARLTVQHVIDDGAVYYVNATEVYRFNVPVGPVAYDTTATTAIRNASLAGPYLIDAGPLVQGVNVLAVEVHQADEASLPGVTLIETGNGGGVPDNLALQSHGALAFAKDALPGYPIHQIPHVNDGLYGNSNSWINNSAGSFAGVAFDQAHAIDRIAFGRDNGGEATQYTDRWGTYTLQYTTVASPDAATPDAAWHDIDTLAYGGGFPDATPWLRHLWGFNPIEGVTGVRVMTHENGICLDEIEVYSAEATDVVFGSTLDATEILDPPELLLNEVAASGAEPFWLEIVNSGLKPASTGGLVIATSAGNQFVLPDQSIPAGGMVSFDEVELGFAPLAGENLYMYGDNRSAVLDAVRVEDRLIGRSSQHEGRWLSPDMPTPGDANHFDLEYDVVINEIMYHPFEMPPGGAAEEEWIELYNRGDVILDLTGWTLEDAVEFTFPAGTTLGPDQYLVVAKDAALLRTRYPGVEIIGDFARSLSNLDDRILLVDDAGNPADTIHYFDGGRWPAFADGGGSSLELRDPDADNSIPEAWAASDERRQSSWNTYTYRGTAQSDGGSTLYREFVLGLLDAGEVLLDDISVIEFPDGVRTEFIQNGTFESGTAEKWRILGTHQDQVITDPDDPTNKVLHLTATGASEDRLNHAETTFVGNRSVTNGREYEISFRAKWLGGSNQINTRLYFNRLPATTLIDVPLLNGTPGAPNSTLEANIAPSYSGLTHAPAVPDFGEPVVVSVTARDPDGIAALTLWYSVDGGAAESVATSDPGGGLYQALIPGQGSASVVQFYVEAEDGLGARSFFPPAGPASRALYKVQDNQARDGLAHNFRIIMTAADAAYLHTPTNRMSNDRLGATVVYKESEVFYNVGVRLKGSNAGRSSDLYVSFNIGFDPMQLFRGVHRTVAVDRSGRGGAVSQGQEEILVKHMLNQAGGVPGMYDDIVYLVAPNSVHNRSALLMMARYGDVFLDSQFPGGSNGTIFKLDIQYVPNGTTNGNPESLKLPYPYNHPSPKDLADYGDDKEAYRWYMQIRNNHAADDYSRIIALSQAMSLSGAALAEAVEPLMDYDEWARLFAMQSLVNCVDTYFRSSLHHNVSFYAPPDDGKILALLWDWDLGIFSNPSASLLGAHSNFRKVVNLPGNLRVFHGHLLDLINTTFNRTNMDRWVSHYGSVAGQDFSPVAAFISSRRSYVLNHLLPSVDFEITTNGGTDFSVDDAAVVIEGTGWIDVREIRLAGNDRPLEVTWLDNERWQITMPIVFGANAISFEGYDYQGNFIDSDAITVTSTIGDRPLQEFLRLTELNYNPADPTPEEAAQQFDDKDLFEFVELQNVGSQTIDLTGARFIEGIDYTFGPRVLKDGVRITEISTGGPDYVEVQNIADGAVDTSGWVIVVNDSSAFQMNDVYPTLWHLPDSLSAGDILYRTSDPDDNYWGEMLFPWPQGWGWVMIVDEAGGVVDFTVWGYGDEQISSFDVTVDGYRITAGNFWDGPAVPAGGDSQNSLRRSGGMDHDDAADWAFSTPQSKGTTNSGLQIPFDGVGAELRPGKFLVLAKNPAAFAARYGSRIDVLGPYDDQLRNSGEGLRLVDANGAVVFDFRYDDEDGWPGRADGKGATLKLIDPSGVPDDADQRIAYLDDPDNWRSSVAYLGTPGTEPHPSQGVVINEVLSHTDWPQVDSIELHNVTDQPIDVGGWYLSDRWGWDFAAPDGGSDDYRKFRIPTGVSGETIIPPHGYLVFDEHDFNPTPGAPAPNHFALNGAHGDDVWLMKADAVGNLTHFGDHVDFGAQANGESWGRWPDGWEPSPEARGTVYPMTRPTLGQPNSRPRLGAVVISEIHYNPGTMLEADDLEFVEIYNASAAAVDLTNWRLRKGVDYDFAPGELLASESAMVIVPFDPILETDKLTAFRTAHNVQGPIEIRGSYSGKLHDDGESVQLQYPDEPPLEEPGFHPGLLADEVIYDDDGPWPIAADGTGVSLHRRSIAAWGDDAASWIAAATTPGTATFDPVVLGLHVFYNGSAFDWDLSADIDGDGQFDPGENGLNDDAAVATDKRPLLPGEIATSANYTSYSRGINGVMIDLANLPTTKTPVAGDFRFHVGNDNTPADWPAAVAPSSVTFRPGTGTGGSDRVTIVWPDGQIRNTWLQVTVLGDNLGLAGDDIFYFGNTVAESGNSSADARVTTADLLLARNNPRDLLTSAGVAFPYDYDRDMCVNATDVLLARNSQTNFLNALQLIDFRGDAAEPQEASLAEFAWVNDQATAKRQSTQQDDSNKATDRLLATYLP